MVLYHIFFYLKEKGNKLSKKLIKRIITQHIISNDMTRQSRHQNVFLRFEQC
jgi:hypothetical protein